MRKLFKRSIALFALALLLVSMVYFPPKASAANLFYGDYTDAAVIEDYGSCPSMQGLAVGSQMLYSIKIKTDETRAFISMTDKDTGTTTKMYNSDNGSYYFTDMGHANDMDVWGIDGSSHLFITSTIVGDGTIVRYKRSSSNLSKVGSYSLSYNGSQMWCSGLSIMSVSGGKITFLVKNGMNLYTGSISTSATSGDIALTKLCTMNRSRVYIKGEYLDLSGWTTQGMGFYQDTLFLPLSGDDSQLNRSVILVFDLRNASGTVFPTEALVFRVTSGAYSALFEIESCDISSGDGKLYFNTNRRVTDSDTNHDGVSCFDGYVFEQLPEDAPTSEPSSYTVRYDPNGGTGTMADTLVYYGVSTQLRTNTYTRNGYEFLGWNAYRTTQDQWYYTNGSSSGWYKEGSQPSGYYLHTYTDGVSVAKTTAVDDDLVIMYAKWEPLAQTYTIRYHANGGTGTMEDTTVVYGYSTPLRQNTFTRAGYQFLGWTAHRTSQDQWYYTNGTSSGWYTEGSQPSGYTKTIYKDQASVAATTAVDGDLVNMYAQWEQNSYTVTFQNEDGTVLSTGTYGYGDTVTAPAAPTKAYDATNHYTFSGWSPAVTAVTGNATYTAAFTAAAHSYTSKVTTAAGCTTDGVETFTCTCGHSYTEAIAATGHSYNGVVTAPGCTERGYTTYTCTVCDNSYIDDVTEATGHSYQSEITTAPGCESVGVETFTCTNCGDTYTKDIAATGHSYDAGTVTAPTCTESGYTTYTCTACGDSYTDDVTEAIGHSYQSEITTAPGCESVGVETFTCTNCGDTYTKDIAATGHSYDAGTVTAPTCTEEGYTTYTCTVCGDSYTDDVTEAIGHSYQSEITTAPGCESAGTKTFTCTNCGDVYTEALAATGHSYEAAVTAPTCTTDGYTTYTCPCGDCYVADLIMAPGHTEETVPGYAATCTETGLTDGVKCSVCDATLTEQEEIPALGHTEETVPGYAADCTNTGLTDGVKCSVCGETLTEQEEIPALGHTEETVPGYAATCTETGLTDGVICAVCGETLTAQEEIPALGHTEETVPGYAATCTETGLTDGVKCSVCDATLTEQEEIPALGHTEESVDGYDPTCTMPGLVNGVRCSVCGEVLSAQETIPALGHTEETVPGYAATCTETGLTDGVKCSVCGETLTAQETIPALGHTEETVPGYAADCTNTGLTDGVKCSVCGEILTEQEEIAALGHTEETVPGYAATCTETGLTDGVKCSVCGEILTEQEEIAALGHTEETVPGYAATCTETGLTDGVKCSVCGETLIAQEEIAALGHTEETVPGYAATCTETGLTDGVKCSVCGEILTAQETIPANGHSFVDGTCTVCGAADPDYVNPVVTPTIKLKYPTLVFEDEILMNVYFAASDLGDVEEMGLITYSQEVTEWNVDNAEAVIPGYTWSEADGFYYATTEGIAAKCLGDTIHFAVYYKLSDGTYGYTGLAGYSPKTYAYNQLKTGSAEMKPIVVAMLKYGAAAQSYFNYNTENLVNADLTEEQNALVEAYRSDMMGTVVQASGDKLGEMVNTGGYLKRYPTISFEGAFCVNYYFQPSAVPVGDITMYIWNQNDFNAAESLTKANATYTLTMEAAGEEYLAVVEGIAAKDLDRGIYVSFCYTDGTTEYCSGVIGYSIGMYCNAQAAKTGTLADLAAATAVYGYYARELFYDAA